MKFTLLVDYADRGKGNKPTPMAEAWREPMNRPEIETEDEAREYAEQIIRDFNDSLHATERPRKLLAVEFGENGATARHDWRKTNLTTQREGARTFDTYACERCGVTGKRFTLDGEVRRDPEFKARAFASCDTARARLDERRRQSTEGNGR